MFVILALLFPFISVIWSIPFILGGPFGFELYKISDPQKRALITRKLPPRSSIKSEGEISGWIYGWPYIGYIHETHGSEKNSSTEIYIYTTKYFYEEITKASNDKSPKHVIIFGRTGNYFNLKYGKRELNINKSPKENQKVAIDRIIQYFLDNGVATVFIFGKPGTGKSTIPRLIAQKLKSCFCDTFNPSEPGDTLELLYNTVLPTKDKPLIVVMEEIDILIANIHKGMPAHKHIPIEVRDKTGFNKFLDHVQDMYPYLILIMTSNKSRREIDLLDSSYLRDGRVNIEIELE